MTDHTPFPWTVDPVPYVSPYLRRPLRSLEQARADLAASGKATPS